MLQKLRASPIRLSPSALVVETDRRFVSIRLYIFVEALGFFLSSSSCISSAQLCVASSVESLLAKQTAAANSTFSTFPAAREDKARRSLRGST